jgi:hypothetical protein
VRRPVIPLLLGGLLLVAAVDASCGGRTEAPSSAYPHDGQLRINQLQAMGTQNSYHLRPSGQAVVPQWDYAHLPIDQQLDGGVRQIELDIHYGENGRFRVFHMPTADDRTTCEFLHDCLAVLRLWSAAHPLHQPIFVLIDPEDDRDTVKLDGRYDELDAEIRAVMTRGELITPDHVRGAQPTLRDAVLAGAWPTLSEARGRVMFILADEGRHRDAYSLGGSSLDGRAMFIYGEGDGPLNAIRNVPDPVGSEAEIRLLVSAGYLVRTQADQDGVEARIGDTTRVQAALRSGAQIISTNYPTPAAVTNYLVAIPTGAPSRCNPASAPAGCTSLDIENPEFLK